MTEKQKKEVVVDESEAEVLTPPEGEVAPEEEQVEPPESVTKGVASADPDEPVVVPAEPQTGDELETPTTSTEPPPAPPPAPAVALFTHVCGVVTTSPVNRCPACGLVAKQEWKRFDVLLA